jgi:hypothetical protein
LQNSVSHSALKIDPRFDGCAQNHMPDREGFECADHVFTQPIEKQAADAISR